MATRGAHRRLPKQRRARQTVDAILDAVVRVLKREGFQAVTTNRIAEVAGVSIGSVPVPDTRFADDTPGGCAAVMGIIVQDWV